MQKIYEFEKDLPSSQEEAKYEGEWLSIYQRMFPELWDIAYEKDRTKQKQQVDRLLKFPNDVTLNAEEKVDFYDNQRVALEIMSNSLLRTPGWLLKPTASHWLVYKKAKLQKCLFMPFRALREAWAKYGEIWTKKAEELEDDFKIAKAQNKGYSSYSVCVPISELVEKVKGAKLVDYSDLPF